LEERKKKRAKWRRRNSKLRKQTRKNTTKRIMLKKQSGIASASQVFLSLFPAYFVQLSWTCTYEDRGGEQGGMEERRQILDIVFPS
jgi:hypothetical protein